MNHTVQVPLVTLVDAYLWQQDNPTTEWQRLLNTDRPLSPGFIAFTFVRTKRAGEILIDGYHPWTGIEGYPVGIWDAAHISEHCVVTGKALLESLARETRSNPRLRHNIESTIEGTTSCWDGLEWINAQVGAELARLRSLIWSVPENQRASNLAFKQKTYETIARIPHGIRYDYIPGSLFTITYPKPVDARAAFDIKPRTKEETYFFTYQRCMAIGTTPIVRTLLRAHSTGQCLR